MPGRVHSGYFLRRQYRAYLGTKPGWADDLLIAKITNLRHGRILTLGFKTQVCHLSARPFYRAIGKEHNRHRRMRSDLSIRTKLMALDYVLADADPVYLATERERVEFFNGRLGIDVDCLPTKTYRLQTTAAKILTVSIHEFRRLVHKEQSIFVLSTKRSSSRIAGRSGTSQGSC